MFAASRLDWLMLVRAVPAAMAVATGADWQSHPEWLTHVIAFIGNDISPWTRLATLITAIALCTLDAWPLRWPRPGGRTLEPAVPS